MLYMLDKPFYKNKLEYLNQYVRRRRIEKNKEIFYIFFSVLMRLINKCLWLMYDNFYGTIDNLTCTCTVGHYSLKNVQLVIKFIIK